MYYPDLASVARVAKMMQRNKKGKEYKGLIPETKEDLPEARKQLGTYFREVWEDEVAALEVENAVTKNSYHEQMGKAIEKRMIKGGIL